MKVMWRDLSKHHAETEWPSPIQKGLIYLAHLVAARWDGYGTLFCQDSALLLVLFMDHATIIGTVWERSLDSSRQF